MRLLRVLLLVAAWLGAGAVALYHLSEARRLQARLGHLDERSQRLERELESALQQREHTHALLEAAATERGAQREADAERRRQAQRAPPERVRLLINAVNRCLREDGYPRLRLLHARGLADGALRDVELLETAADGLGADLYTAAELRLSLDRAEARLAIELRQGTAVCAGERRPLRDDERIVLRPVDGRLWEEATALVLRAEGQYPDTALAVRAAAPPGLTALEKQEWIARFDRLLAAADTELRYRVGALGALGEGVFREVMVLGYDERGTLTLAIEAERLTAIVDDRLGIVELLLERGILRRGSREITIPAAGYSVLLPGVRRAEAMEHLIGMLVERSADPAPVEDQ